MRGIVMMNKVIRWTGSVGVSSIGEVKSVVCKCHGIDNEGTEG